MYACEYQVRMWWVIQVFREEKEKETHQVSDTNFQRLTGSPLIWSQILPGQKTRSPVTPASERMLYLSSPHLSIKQQLCTLHTPAQCPEVIDQMQHHAHPTLRKHKTAQDKSWAAFEAKATPASDNNTEDTKATWRIARENKPNKVSAYSLPAAMISPPDFTSVRINLLGWHEAHACLMSEYYHG